MESIHETEGMHYEGDCIRPPREADSILLQATLGCSHNKCTFCGTFKNKRFRIKDDEIILSDILFASKHMKDLDHVFLMDGDALIIPYKKLMWILEKIREHLPWVKQVGAYANTKSISMKSDKELVDLRNMGLGMLYLGVETGDDEIREKIIKGSSARQCLEMAKKVKCAGMQLATLVLLGIAGKEKSLRHAGLTGEIISRIDPDFASALTLILLPNTPIYKEYAKGEFEMPDEIGLLKEMKELVNNIHLSNCLFSTNHASNYLPVKIMFPEGKQKVLDLIDSALKGELKLRPEWMRAF
jgi:radical SAM superfamily enzyme YgiQ (UPF0313 family)